jgi:hypothetical protein
MLVDPFTLQIITISVLGISGYIFSVGIVDGYRSPSLWELIDNHSYLTGPYILGSFIGNTAIRPIVNSFY